MCGVGLRVSPLPRLVTLALAAILIFACTMEQSDPSGSSSGSGTVDGPLDEWQGIWDFDWMVVGGGCPTLFSSDTRFVKVRWVGNGELMFIYDEDWDGEFEDTAVLTGYPGGASVSVQGHYVSNGAQYHVNGTLVNVEQDYITGELYRDIVGACTEQQEIDAYRISYQPSTFEGSFPKARVLFRDDVEGMVEFVSVRSSTHPERTLHVDTTAGERVLIDVPAGDLRFSVPGHPTISLELREGEVRDVFLSSLVSPK